MKVLTVTTVPSSSLVERLRAELNVVEGGVEVEVVVVGVEGFEEHVEELGDEVGVAVHDDHEAGRGRRGAVVGGGALGHQ